MVRKYFSFNPLDRVKFVQIYVIYNVLLEELGDKLLYKTAKGFNPLDRVKFVQI